MDSFIIIAILVFLIFLYLCFKYNSKKVPKTIIEENKDTLKFDVVSPNKKTNMLFETADLQHYFENTNTKPKETFIIHQPVEEPKAINNIADDVNNFDLTDLFQPQEPMLQLIPMEQAALIRQLHQQIMPIMPMMPPVVGIYDPEAQNVHDSEVGRGVRKIFSDHTLLKHGEFDVNILIDDIIDYSAGKNAIDRGKIITVLDKVKQRNATITNVNNATELELLSTVWKAATQNPNIKDMLLTQIADTFENSGVLCPTGFVNRISTALVVDNPERFPKTKELYNAEIMQIASNLRNELELDTAYSSKDDVEKSIEFKAKLLTRLEKDYDGILTVEEIQALIASWIDLI